MAQPLARLNEPKQGAGGAVSIGSVGRITFVAEPGEGAKVRREFTQPRRMTAVETPVASESAGARAHDSSVDEQCFIVFVPEGGEQEPFQSATGWHPPEHLRGAAQLTVERGSTVIEWRPGLAVVTCAAADRGDVTTALVDFAFYEGQLRELERLVTAGEVQAAADVTPAHRLPVHDRRLRDSLTESMETFSRARLAFARLEPQFSSELSTLPAPARRWLARLLEEAGIEDRAEALSDRLEALEDFYEAANQRAADFRWYREGRVLETSIIVILLLECILMAGDIYFHLRR